MLIVKSIIYTILVPATVTIFLPILILMQSPISGLPSLRMTQALSLIPIAVGTAILLHSIWMFASVGRGTLVSWDAPRNFVVKGLYRYVRNPMYVGILLILLGEAVFFKSRAILEYTVGWFIVINLVVMLYESRRCEIDLESRTSNIGKELAAGFQARRCIS